MCPKPVMNLQLELPIDPVMVLQMELPLSPVMVLQLELPSVLQMESLQHELSVPRRLPLRRRYRQTANIKTYS